MLFVVSNEEGRRLYLVWPDRTRKQAPVERLDISLPPCDILDQPNIVCTGFYLGKEQRSMPENERGREAGRVVCGRRVGRKISAKGCRRRPPCGCWWTILAPRGLSAPNNLWCKG